MGGGAGLPALVVAACVHWWVVVALRSRCWWAWCPVMGGEGGKFLLDSYWTPSTGFLLDSYWIPTGLLVLDSSIPIP